jgi:hypothetical protein
MKRKIPCREGDWFTVPLKNEGNALGLVARYRHKGRIALGYFFECPENMNDIESHIRELTPDASILIILFNWPPDNDPIYRIIYHDNDWDRNKWPAPFFGHVDVLNPWRAQITYYDFDDPDKFSKFVSIVSPEEVASLYPDILAGYLALPPRLDKIIRNRKAR